MLGGCCYGACDAMPRREAKAEAIPRRAKNEASERGRFGAQRSARHPSYQFRRSPTFISSLFEAKEQK